jgi:hypothetical protein
MIAQVFYSNSLILDGKDNDKILTHEDLSLDDENLSKEVTIKIKNPLNEYLPFFFLKLVLTNSIGIKKISRELFSNKFKISLTTESGTYVFSSDEEAYQNDFLVGILYTENSEYINTMLEEDVFPKKFILIPRGVRPEEELEYLLKVEVLDPHKNFFRKSSVDIHSYVQTFSRDYYQVLSEENTLIGVLLQHERVPIFSFSFLNGGLERAKNYFFSLYTVNGVRLLHDSSSFDSYYFKVDDKLLNYSVNKRGNFVGTKFRLNFNYDNSSDSYFIDVATEHEEEKIWEYITDLIYLTLLEISKPLTFNSGFVPENLQDVSEKISSTYVYLLNLLKSTLPVYETIKSDGSFLSSSRALSRREKYDLYSLLFSWAKIYSSFLRKLNSLGFVEMTGNVQSISNLTEDVSNVSLFFENYKNVRTFRFSNDLEFNDLTISALLSIYAYMLGFDNRNTYFYSLGDTFKFASSLFFEVARNLLISTSYTEIDVNNYSQSTVLESFSLAQHSEIIKQKLLAYTLLDTFFSRQIANSTNSFFDYILCEPQTFCTDSRERFVNTINVDDDIVNLFNSYVETHSCSVLDSENLVFVTDPEVCTSISNVYRNMDVNFFNLWVFLQNMNYKVRPTVFQVKVIFGMI